MCDHVNTLLGLSQGLEGAHVSQGPFLGLFLFRVGFLSMQSPGDSLLKDSSLPLAQPELNGFLAHVHQVSAPTPCVRESFADLLHEK